MMDPLTPLQLYIFIDTFEIPATGAGADLALSMTFVNSNTYSSKNRNILPPNRTSHYPVFIPAGSNSDFLKFDI
jgi:hypothetical protein